jgi:hypothetical protein
VDLKSAHGDVVGFDGSRDAEASGSNPIMLGRRSSIPPPLFSTSKHRLVHYYTTNPGHLEDFAMHLLARNNENTLPH